MPLQISSKTKQDTTKCPFSFQCLEEATRNVCPVSIYIEKNGCIIGRPKQDTCPYRALMGRTSLVCNCPIRHELYRRYRI